MKLNDFEEIMVFAIEKEEMSYKFYRQASLIVKDKKAHDLCIWIAEEEKKHIQTLEKFKENHASHFLHQTLENSEWLQIQIQHEIKSSMIPKDVLNIARKHEKKSLDFYMKMSENSEDGKCKELFLVLAKEEESHYHKLNNLISSSQFK